MSRVEIVKELCRKRGITVKALEQELGFGEKSINKWDKNAPSITKMEAVADYFGVSVDYLLGKSKKEASTVIDVTEFVNAIIKDDSMPITYNGKDLSSEDRVAAKAAFNVFKSIVDAK